MIRTSVVVDVVTLKLIDGDVASDALKERLE